MTPGSVATFRCICSYMLSWSALLRPVPSIGISMESTFSTPRPVSTTCSFMSVLTRRPAPVSNTTDTATCATTSARCKRCFLRLPLIRRTPAEIHDA